MPGNGRRVPQVAEMEDYDSDDSSAKPGTRVRATRKTPTSVRPAQRRDTASDSGYSSHSGAANVAAQTQAVVSGSSSARQPAPASSSRSKPVIHTTDRQPDKAIDQSRPSYVSRPSNTERRYTLPQQTQQEYAQKYAAWAAQYPEAAAKHQRQMQQQQQQHMVQQAQAAPAPVMSNVTSQPRPGATSTSQRARPMSIHGYGIPSAPNTAPYGPPPSPSAYQNNLAAYYQQYQQQQYQQPSTYLSSTPPTQIMTAYPVQSPVANSPTSPQYGAMPTVQQKYAHYSARQANPNVSGLTYDLSKVSMTSQPTLTRTMSARQTSGSYMPGTFPEQEAVESESDSEESEPDYSEDERQRARNHKRDSKLMPPPSRRPSIHTRSTAPVNVPSRSSRQSIQRAPRSDTYVDYPSSSEQFDSDRTARAAVGRTRTESSFSSRSRRPSISTTASSGRTKATTVSEGSGTRKVMIEDKDGRRRTAYLSQDQQDDLARRYERERREDEERREVIEAYQQKVRGPLPTELTADNIRKAAKRTSGSHVSRDSRKTSSSKASRSDGILIQAGDTVLHVHGEANIEMHPGEDGGPAVFKIGNSRSGRDSAYYGSSKSGSRLSKRKESNRQVDEYEEAL
ncbi:hypothetical protein LTR36_009787 [Oleoguttula mirabilis]|uniref:Uncharacterized protein n=1 Tax=Oleoguttula mirabilis TaxID=1507867 RepID=A0AAV9J553_9PEZI|nr:hypothetical protein LTR36_009787 [Oleoguttula mirabilis]